MRRPSAALALVFALVVAVLLLAAPRPHAPRTARFMHGRVPEPEFSTGTADNSDAQAEMEFLTQRDPVANAIPRAIHARELAFARALPLRLRSRGSGATDASRATALTWTERGPNNVGGRTRVFAIDVSNPTTLLAGSVAGGMWRSSDDGASWTLTTAPGQIHSTTCIAQDRRTGHLGTWYVGTGEIRGSTTNATRWGSLYLGDGIFKSVDNGSTWTLLSSTSTGTPQTVDPFDYVNNVATNPANLAQDEVLAATYKGIYRSTNGGTSWSLVQVADSGYTDVAITPAGAMYAATRNSSLIRIWRSTNGTTWTQIQPATFPTSANRVVFGLAPSNPNVVYVFVQGANNSPAVAGHQLWKYNYLSGDGSGAGGSWVNRGGNLPADINTQAGYDQVVHVKPNDENFVIIGGQNLYRSTNGFSSTLATTVIGGYDFFPDGHHHPDLHAGGFSPASSTVYYSAGDGGISRAADITLPSMVWESLNHGYNVTQFYSVSIGPDAGSNLILAGAQDNGSQLGDAPGASDWVMAYGGDGTVVAIAPAVQDRLYTQYQGGQIQRQNYDGSNLVDFTPDGSVNQLFVNPIALDPVDPAVLYYGSGNSSTTSMIWRNDDAPNATNATGWSIVPGTDVGTGGAHVRAISAIAVSQTRSPHVIYYGTTDGLVKRLNEPGTAFPVVTDITPPGLAAGTATGGFVRCIAIDPYDSQRALLCFGNYNFPSVWFTTNGGATWTNVEGNIAGAAGPSVRWAQMFYVDGQLEVFLGTSIGVLSTTALAGGSTVWSQEAATAIGNVLIAWMDYRASDRTLAVATHARGVFTTQFAPVLDAGGGPPLAGGVRLGPCRPNPAVEMAALEYELPQAGDVSLRLFDVAGRLAAVLVDGHIEAGRHDVRFDTRRLAAGVYYAVLRAEGATASRAVVVRP